MRSAMAQGFSRAEVQSWRADLAAIPRANMPTVQGCSSTSPSVSGGGVGTSGFALLMLTPLKQTSTLKTGSASLQSSLLIPCSGCLWPLAARVTALPPPPVHLQCTGLSAASKAGGGEHLHCTHTCNYCSDRFVLWSVAK
jgi:hypothetical protein